MFAFATPDPEAPSSGISDFIPSAPDFVALGPLSPIVTAVLGIALAIVGFLGLLSVFIGALQCGIGALSNNGSRVASGFGQVKVGLVLMVASVVGGALLLIGFNIIVGIFS